MPNRVHDFNNMLGVILGSTEIAKEELHLSQPIFANLQQIKQADDRSVEIHLLLTDVIMLEMNGRLMTDKLKINRSELKCLFMSGYTGEMISNHGVLDEGVCFIQKPFSKIEVAAKVREALGR